MLPFNLDSLGLVFYYSYETQKRLVRYDFLPREADGCDCTPISSDRLPRFLYVVIFRFLQAAMESSDVVVAFRVMMGRAPLSDAQPI